MRKIAVSSLLFF